MINIREKLEHVEKTQKELNCDKLFQISHLPTKKTVEVMSVLLPNILVLEMDIFENDLKEVVEKILVIIKNQIKDQFIYNHPEGRSIGKWKDLDDADLNFQLKFYDAVNQLMGLDSRPEYSAAEYTRRG